MPEKHGAGDFQAIGMCIRHWHCAGCAVTIQLSSLSGLPLKTAANMIEATQDTGAFVQLSGVLKRIAAKLSKVCNDLRLLSSGPQARFG